jgi:hypothetical protein
MWYFIIYLFIIIYLLFINYLFIIYYLIIYLFIYLFPYLLRRDLFFSSLTEIQHYFFGFHLGYTNCPLYAHAYKNQSAVD